MKELVTYTPSDLMENRRQELTLFFCDESAITCRTLRKLQEVINTSQNGVILAIPDSQYQEGLRGWAKVQVLASVADNLSGVMSLSFESASQELGQNWAQIIVNGEIFWRQSQSITTAKEEVVHLEITVATDEFDKAMITCAKKAAKSSNCWQDPAGCVITKDDEVLVESASINFNNANCPQIPVDFKELPLKPDERMFFCDSLHAERVGISQAAKEGISLEDATLYVTKFPCRSCLQSVIAAGIKTIVFEQESYGLLEIADLFESKQLTVKRILS